MTTYAGVPLVMARAGKVAASWEQEGSVPGISEIESYLATASAEIDAAIAAHGYAVPVENETAVDALAGLAADKAILLALPATFVRDRAAVSELRDATKARVEAGELALEAGTHMALAVLGQQQTAGASSATSLWSPDSPAGLSAYERAVAAPRVRRGDVL